MADNYFSQMSDLIQKFNNEKLDMTVTELQTLREDISLCLFYLSDDAAKAIANYESNDFKRKQLQAEKETKYRESIDPKTNKNYTVADSERKARLELKDIEQKLSESCRQKERAKIVLNAVREILNAISSKINQLSKAQ